MKQNGAISIQNTSKYQLMPDMSPAEFEALKAELALLRHSPLKHRVYMLLLKLFYRDDGPRLQRHLTILRRFRSGLSVGRSQSRGLA